MKVSGVRRERHGHWNGCKGRVPVRIDQSRHQDVPAAFNSRRVRRSGRTTYPLDQLPTDEHTGGCG